MKDNITEIDVGYGLGYYAIAFAQKGFQVFAFDPSDQYMDINRRKKGNILHSGVASQLVKHVLLNTAFGKQNL